MAYEKKAMNPQVDDFSSTSAAGVEPAPSPVPIVVANPYVKEALEGSNSADDGGTPYESFTSFHSWSRAS